MKDTMQYFVECGRVHMRQKDAQGELNRMKAQIEKNLRNRKGCKVGTLAQDQYTKVGVVFDDLHQAATQAIKLDLPLYYTVNGASYREYDELPSGQTTGTETQRQMYAARQAAQLQ